MNKDALLATIIGFVVGLIITGIILVAPKLSSFMPKISVPSISIGLPNPQTTPTPATAGAFLTIDSPISDSIEPTLEILVSGTTEAGATVVIQTDSDDEVVLAKEDGKFAEKINLIEGKNDLSVTSYGKTNQDTKTVVVFHTKEDF